MSIAYLLVILGLAAFGAAAWALFWAVDAGQYDDVEAQGAAILDEPEVPLARTPAAAPDEPEEPGLLLEARPPDSDGDEQRHL